MYRKYIITDEAGHEIEFICHPSYSVHNLKQYIQVVKDNIGMTLHARKCMLDMVEIINCSMDTNTVNKIEVVEIQE